MSDSEPSKESTSPRSAGVILAAGLSERFGQDPIKQLARAHGEALVRRAARCALRSNLDRVVVVLGHRAEEVGEALDGLDVERVLNRDYRRGQSTSVRNGLARVAAEVDAALFLPIDQPGLEASTLDLILQELEGPRTIVVPCHADRRGAPVLFGRAHFDDILGLAGDEGARQLLRAKSADVRVCSLPSERPLIDVDTPSELDEWHRIAGTDP